MTLVFTAPGWQWIACAAVVAAVVLAVLEWRRGAPHRALRAALVAIAVLALGAIGVRPDRSRPISDVTSIVLVASGGESPIRRAPADAVSLADSLQVALVLRDSIPDLAWLRRHQPGLDTLHVTGAGLDAADRRAADGIVVRLHAGDPRPGVTQLAWTRVGALGQPVVVGGRIAAAPPGTWVRLEGPGGTADSARTDSLGGFTLASVPRAAGRQLYVVKTGADAVAAAEAEAVAETLGVMVEPRRLPRVLVLESAPSFETRYLKAWLGDRGGEVAVRSLVGRGMHRYEYLNRPEIPLGRITSATLASFDVVIADGRTLAALSTAERAALRGAIADSGRGLLLRADEVVLGDAGSLPDRGFFVAAPAARLTGPEERSSRVTWASRAVPTANWSLGEHFATSPLAETPDGGDLVAVAPRGAGRVAVTLVREPGRWLLAGEGAAFGEYWTRLLTPLAEGVRRPGWQIAHAGPLVANAAVDLVLVAGDTAGSAVVTGPGGVSDTVHLSPDPLEPGRRRAAWWPREAGWHGIEGGGAALDFYVGSKSSSADLIAAQRIAATRRTAVLSGAGRTANDSAASMRSSAAELRPIDPFPFFALLVAALGALWIVGGPRAAARLSAVQPAASGAPPPAR